MTTWSINSSINNGYPYHSDISIPYPVEFTKPYPKWMWKLNSTINNGYPYFESIPIPVAPNDRVDPNVCGSALTQSPAYR